jgi:hypothetical protein
VSKFSESLNNYNRLMLIAATVALLYVGIALALSRQVLWAIFAFVGFAVFAAAFFFSLPFRRKPRRSRD